MVADAAFMKDVLFRFSPLQFGDSIPILPFISQKIVFSIFFQLSFSELVLGPRFDYALPPSLLRHLFFPPNDRFLFFSPATLRFFFPMFHYRAPL